MPDTTYTDPQRAFLDDDRERTFVSGTPRHSVATVLEHIQQEMARGNPDPLPNGWERPGRMTIRDSQGRHADIECDLHWHDSKHLVIGVDYGVGASSQRFAIYEVKGDAIREVTAILDEPPDVRVWAMLHARLDPAFPVAPKPRPKKTPPPQPERFRKRGRRD